MMHTDSKDVRKHLRMQSAGMRSARAAELTRPASSAASRMYLRQGKHEGNAFITGCRRGRAGHCLADIPGMWRVAALAQAHTGRDCLVDLIFAQGLL